jgi:Cyclophilin type peptidyl-prolyl cis-trans isomerase/CLD
MTVEKANQAAAFVDNEEGGVLKQGLITITLDGYSAPVNAGAFAKLVRDGKYDGKTWGVGYASVVAGKGAAPRATVPLEILPIGALCTRLRLHVMRSE